MELNMDNNDVRSGVELDNKDENAGGGIEQSSSLRQDVQLDPVGKLSTTDKLKLIRTMIEGEPIRGLTAMNGELHIVYGDSKFITVFDSQTFGIKRSIPVPLLGRIVDMTSCKRHLCLYVSDCENRVVHRVDVQNVQNVITQWPIDGYPHGMSVNSLGNLLVTCGGHGSVVKEFTTDGVFIREVKGFLNPLHAAELTADSLVVCYDFWNWSGVRVVDWSGRVLHSFGGWFGSGRGQLDDPACLAVNGVVLVADTENHRVLMLSKTLRYVRVAVSGLRDPCAMCFDDVTGHLYVADNKYNGSKYVSGVVKVYGVK